ncbi:YadA-like family protein [Pseudomonas pseudonitroreducens]|uniref:YadA-like family protein n=1 Tax=Pseudomonas pseudonitroreducens TaxID=2892326 RepID=UPI001F2B07F1|nr:YadA-like family protein [Pseudomonas pseudonitroreducens]
MLCENVNNIGSTTASALGGGATYNSATGVLTAPSFALGNANLIGGTTGAATDVGSGFGKVDAALGKLNTSVTGNTTSINNLTTNLNNGSVGLVQQSAAGANLSVGKDTDGAAVDFLGTGGARKLINVKDGSVAANSKEALNGNQLFGVSQSVMNAIGGGAVMSPDGTIRAPSFALSNANLIAGTTGAATNIGAGFSKVDAALGNLGTSVAGNTTSINNLTTNLNNGSVGLVQQSAAGANLAVGKDTDGAAVDFLGTGGARKLINVKDGTVAANSKEALNGNQLFGVSQSVMNAIGGGAVMSPDGTIRAPSFALNNANLIAGTTGAATNIGAGFSKVDAALGNLDTSVAGNTTSISNLDARVTTNEGDISNINTSITNIGAQINSGTIGLVQQSAAGENLSVGKDTDGAAVDFLGTDGARKLINVADGSVAADSKEAVNGSQLFGVSQSVASAMGGGSVVNADGSISAPSYVVTNADGSTSSVNNLGDVISNIDNRTAQNTTDITNNTTSINNLDGRVTNVEGDISTITTNLNSGTIGLVQQSAAGENLTVGKDTDGAAVDFLGTAGARKLVNVADGSVAADSKEAVNGSQLFGVSQSVASAMGGGSVVNADGSISAPSYVVTNADGSTSSVGNMGDAISNIDARTVQNSTDISSINSTIGGLSGLMGDAVMYDSAAHDKVTLGSAGKAVQLSNLKAGELSADSSDAVNGAQLFETNQNVALIDGRVTNLEGSVTNIANGGGIKYFHTSSSKADSVASGADAIAVGGNAVASAEGSVALGADAEASAKGSIALGQGASDNGRGAESYSGKYSGADNATVGTVSIGNAATGETRALANVADGKAATDAVNLRQLDGAVAESKSYTDSKVSGITDGMAASVAQVDNRVSKVEADVSNVQNGTDGMFQVKNSQNLPKPKVTGNNAVAGGAGAEAVAENSTAIGSNAKAVGKNSVAIGANSVAERDNSVAVGSAGNERQITHVAAGVERTDAVNVGQVNDALNALNSESNQRYNDLKHDLSEQDDQLSAGIAGAIAIASLPQPMVNGGSTTAVGVGTYNGQSAVSVGVSHVSNDGKWTTKLGGSTDTQGRFSAGGAVGYNW